MHYKQNNQNAAIRIMKGKIKYKKKSGTFYAFLELLNM